MSFIFFYILKHHITISTPKSVRTSQHFLAVLDVVGEISETNLSNYEKSINNSFQVVRSFSEHKDKSLKLDLLSNAESSLLQRRLNKKSNSIESNGQ
jgi:hypothetical protein